MPDMQDMQNSDLPQEETGLGQAQAPGKQERQKGKRDRKQRQKRGVRPLDILIGLVFLAGLGIMLYPKMSDLLNRLRARRSIDGYEKEIGGIDEADYSDIFARARAYNQRLKENPNPFSEEHRTPGYDETLRVGSSGIMGIITIDKIHVRLPFYHGTEEEVLQTAVGHLEGSSLPIGEKGDHAVLSAHRGLPSAELFTDLPSLEVGDRFIVTVLNRVMTYEVDQILTVLPHEMEALERDESQDLVTLITCTPYGVNSHRLLVRGHRVE